MTFTPSELRLLALSDAIDNRAPPKPKKPKRRGWMGDRIYSQLAKERRMELRRNLGQAQSTTEPVSEARCEYAEAAVGMGMLAQVEEINH